MRERRGAPLRRSSARAHGLSSSAIANRSVLLKSSSSLEAARLSACAGRRSAPDDGCGLSLGAAVVDASSRSWARTSLPYRREGLGAGHAAKRRSRVAKSAGIARHYRARVASPAISIAARSHHYRRPTARVSTRTPDPPTSPCSRARSADNLHRAPPPCLRHHPSTPRRSHESRPRCAVPPSLWRSDGGAQPLLRRCRAESLRRDLEGAHRAPATRSPLCREVRARRSSA